MIIIGILDKRLLQERLLRESDITLENAIKHCQVSEVTKKHVKILQHQAAPASVAKISTKKVRTSKCHAKESLEEFIKQCKFCSYRHKRGKCPAYNKVCKKCSKKGHFAKFCFKKDTHEIEQNSSEESNVCHDSDSSSSSFFVGSVESKQVDVKPDSNNGSDTPYDPNNVYTCDDTQNSEWKISLQSNGSDVEYKIDTGA